MGAAKSARQVALATSARGIILRKGVSHHPAATLLYLPFVAATPKGVFGRARAAAATHPAPSVWAAKDMMSAVARPPAYGTTQAKLTQNGRAVTLSAAATATGSASTGKLPKVVAAAPTMTATCAQAAVPPGTALDPALSRRGLEPAFTPYITDAWEDYLRRGGLTNKYPKLVQCLREGFVLSHLHYSEGWEAWPLLPHTEFLLPAHSICIISQLLY